MLNALKVARGRGLTSVLLTGEVGVGAARSSADLVLAVPSGETPRIQEIHLMLGHFLCEAVERSAIAAG